MQCNFDAMTLLVVLPPKLLCFTSHGQGKHNELMCVHSVLLLSSIAEHGVLRISIECSCHALGGNRAGAEAVVV
jgi:hypothetical protein